MASSNVCRVKRSKRALVIGNNDYHRPENRLINCINDANGLTRELNKFNFEVTIKHNLDNVEMRNVINNFASAIADGDLVIFYFSGHGYQVHGKNYLIPVDDTKINTDNDVQDRAYDVNRLLEQLSNRNSLHVTLFILDCCRKYWPMKDENTRGDSGTGLSYVTSPAGTYVQFACDVNQTASDGTERDGNGLFTKHLLEHIKNPDEDILQIFQRVQGGVLNESRSIPKQSPLGINKLTTSGRIYLKDTPYIIIKPGPVPPPPPQPPPVPDTLPSPNRVIPNIPVNAKWNQNGVTVAGGNGYGNATNQLNCPWGIFVDVDQTVVIADCGNHRIVQWKKDHTNGEVIAGDNGKGNRLDQLNHPSDVLIDRETDSLIIADRRNRRVVRWPRLNGKKQGEILIDDIDCFGLAMDDHRYLYVSDSKTNEVKRYRFGEMNVTLVARGRDKRNKYTYRINSSGDPMYIFVDQQQNLYVSDYDEFRIMKWNKGAKEGIIVAGANGLWDALTRVSGHHGIFVDASGTLYAVDARTKGVMRFCQGDKKGTIIVGGNDKGTEANQFYAPMGLSFDRYGNLYVADGGNSHGGKHCVKRFDIINEHREER